MTKVRLDPILLKKLSTKTGKREKYLRERISNLASKRGVSSEAYFVYWLNKERISAAVYQRRLSSAIRDEIRELLKDERVSTRKTTPTRKQKIQKAEKVFQIHELKIKPKPSLITQDLLKKAHQSASLYPALFIFENSVRIFIQKTLAKNYGKKWWDNKVNRSIRDNVKIRIQNEKMNAWHGSRGAHEIHYTDFVDLAKIIKNNADVFNELFKNIGGRINWLTQKLEELSLSRNNIAHVSPLKSKDRERFLLYFQDWYEQLDLLNDRMK